MALDWYLSRTYEADKSPALRLTHLHTTFAYTHEVQTRFTATLPHKKDITANMYVFPLVTEQYTKCSNRTFVLLKMGIMMPETC